MKALAVAVLLLLPAACGPVTVEQAERQCLERARLAEHPRGMVKIGTGRGGSRVGGSISISSDFIQGRDPSALYDSCVQSKSGQLPRRPYYTLESR
ncbi:MAG: hypothetical protein R3D84_14790 [Paracoccaceae bacterium]